MIRSGDTCDQCGRAIQVVNTVVDGETRIRYLGCRHCGHRPDNNKQILPERYAPRRLRMPPSR